MTDFNGDVLTSGPGSPASSIRRADPAAEPDEYGDVLVDLDDEDLEIDEEPAATAGGLRSIVAGVFSAESLAVAGLLMLLLALPAQLALMEIASSVSGLPVSLLDDSAAATRLSTGIKIYSTFNLLCVAASLLGVAAGVASLLVGRVGAARWTRGIAGAAVLGGIVLALVHLAASRTGASPFGIY